MVYITSDISSLILSTRICSNCLHIQYMGTLFISQHLFLKHSPLVSDLIFLHLTRIAEQESLLLSLNSTVRKATAIVMMR